MKKYMQRLLPKDVIVNELPFILVIMALLSPHLLFYSVQTLKLLTGGEYVAFFKSAIDTLQCFALSMTMAYILASVVNVFKRKTLRIIFYILFIVVAAMRLFLKYNFGLEFGPMVFTLIGETTSSEASNFISVFIFKPDSIRAYMFVVTALLIVFTEYLYRKKFLNKLSEKIYINTISKTLAFICFCSAVYTPVWYAPLLHCKDTNEVSYWYYHVAPNKDFMITQLLYSYTDINLAKKDLSRAINATASIKDEQVGIANMDSLNIVVVIGESYIKHHAQVYGYYLPTSPRLMVAKEKENLILFNDAVTPYNVTSEVLKNILCCNSMGHNESWQDFPLFPAVMKKAGYYVYFWDNQKAVNIAPAVFAMNFFLFNPQVCQQSYTFLNDSVYQYDDDLLADFEYHHPVLSNRKNLIIYHLNGQHFDAVTRYPHTLDFERFDFKSIKRNDAYLTKEKKQRIAEYDNACLYNDSVMAHLFRQYNSTNSVIVYFSDHGEEVYDYRDQYGRMYNCGYTKDYLHCEYDIPMMIWMSDVYKETHPEKVKAVTDAADKPFMLDNLCHLIFNIGGVHTKFYHSDRDVLSPHYRAVKRKIDNCVFYEDIMNR